MTSHPLLTRRAFSAGLLATASFCCPACGARAQTKLKLGGKMLCASAAQGLPDEEKLIDSTGNMGLNSQLSAEMLEQSRFFGMRPAFMLYTGPNENAIAMSQAQLPGTQGTILYNLGFLQKQLKSSQWGGAVIAGVIAHEFTHIFQFYSDYGQRLEKLHATVKFQELHADYVSAFYMARKHVSSKVNLEAYFDEFYRLGDYQFDSKDHHGTREERYFAIKGGHNLSLLSGDKDIRFAAAQGETFLKEYFR